MAQACGLCRLSENWISTAIPYENRGYLPNYGQLYMDSAVLVYAFGVALLSVLLFSISPVLEGWRLNLTSALKESGGASSAGARSQRLRQALVICQVVLAMIVIVPGGLTTKEMALVLRESPGFRADHLLTAEIALPAAKYSEPARRRAFHERVAAKTPRRATSGIGGGQRDHSVRAPRKLAAVLDRGTRGARTWRSACNADHRGDTRVRVDARPYAAAAGDLFRKRMGREIYLSWW